MEPPDVDLALLRDERLARLQAAMRAHDLDGCLLFSEPNTRYATGVTAMPVWSMSTFTRCAVVAQEGTPILFEHPNSIHRSRERALDVRPMAIWEFLDRTADAARAFARTASAALTELGVARGRIGVDRLAAPAFLALQAEGLELVDAAPATMDAREVHTSQEIALFRWNGRMMVEALAPFEAAIVPGVEERELFAVLAREVLARGAEYLATNTVCSGPNTNPWRAEATERRVRAGELVYLDTDTVGFEGCFFCVSRTFAVPGAEPSAAARDTYRAAHEWVLGTTAVLKPGMTCAEVADAAPPTPERYRAQRYECMIHGVGLEEENPTVAHPFDEQPNPDRVLQPGMALVVETYMGEVGADHGVKLGDVVLVTDDGAEVLAPYPYADALLA
jgi:Xaa-Pro aminopeptidase